MNNIQLQEAINKAREFISNPVASSMTSAIEAKNHTKDILRKLEEIQVIRARLMTKPSDQMGGK